MKCSRSNRSRKRRIEEILLKHFKGVLPKFNWSDSETSSEESCGDEEDSEDEEESSTGSQEEVAEDGSDQSETETEDEEMEDEDMRNGGRKVNGHGCQESGVS